MDDINVQQDSPLNHLKCAAETRPYLDSVVRHIGLLVRVEVALPDLLELYLA